MEKPKYSAKARVNAALFYFVDDFIMPGCNESIGEWDIDEKDIITDIPTGEGKALEKRLFIGESPNRISERDEERRIEGQYEGGPKIILNLGLTDEELEARPKLMVSMYSPLENDKVYMRITHKMDSTPGRIEEADAELDLVYDLKKWARENSINGDIIEGQDQTLALMDPKNYNSDIPIIQKNLDAENLET